MISEDDLQKIIVPGSKFKIYYNPGNIKNKLLHICAIVDDDQVVYKYWRPIKKNWRYEVDDFYWFSWMNECGFLKKA